METTKKTEAFSFLPFGSIKPTGWLKKQMQDDIKGFAGNLDRIVPDLIYDPIYSTGRLGRNSKSKNLGNTKEGDAAGDEQYNWWNSETQSNWQDGYLRNVFLLNNKNGIARVKEYVKQIVATQDNDGYIGIYDKVLRYSFDSENGELWSKATLYRGLLAYYEYTNDRNVFNAVEKAVENYPLNASSPFNSGTSFNGGVSHGLTFTDVFEKVFQINDNVQLTFETGIQQKETKNGSYYLNYGALLYALPIKAKEITGRVYTDDFKDYMYETVSKDVYLCEKDCGARYENGKIQTRLINRQSGEAAIHELIPIGKTILRQVTFENI